MLLHFLVKVTHCFNFVPDDNIDDWNHDPSPNKKNTAYCKEQGKLCCGTATHPGYFEMKILVISTQKKKRQIDRSNDISTFINLVK